MALCKLCLQDKQLIKKTHIIPDFMYQDLFDDKHRMIVFNPNAKPDERSILSRPFTGEYEGELLCADCDGKVIGEYESYASKAIYGGQLHKNECPTCKNHFNQHGVHFTRCTNINYKKFKIFLLSILWRSSISSRPFFNEISLGPHAETIRKMIYTGDAGDVSNYPIFFVTYVNDKAMTKDLVAHPQKRRTKEGHSTFVFMIGGLIYTFYVTSTNHKIPDFILSETIKPNNEMNILHIPPGQAMQLILGFHGIGQKPKR